MQVESNICAEIVSTLYLPGKKNFYKVFYKVCFIEWATPLLASYPDDKEIFFYVNRGKSENIIQKVLLGKC